MKFLQLINRNVECEVYILEGFLLEQGITLQDHV